MTRQKKIEPLSTHEEGILRSTIDEAEKYGTPVPPKTVRGLLARIDELRDVRSGRDMVMSALGRITGGETSGIVKVASPFDPLLAIEKFADPLPDVPASDALAIDHAVQRIKTVHPDVDSWLHELAENANSVEMVERELFATLIRALANAVTIGLHQTDHVTAVSFVQNPLDPNTFFLRMTTNGEKSERIVTRGECAAYLRHTLAERAFDLNGKTLHGAELADLIERGLVP